MALEGDERPTGRFAPPAEAGFAGRGGVRGGDGEEDGADFVVFGEEEVDEGVLGVPAQGGGGEDGDGDDADGVGGAGGDGGFGDELGDDGFGEDVEEVEEEGGAGGSGGGGGWGGGEEEGRDGESRGGSCGGGLKDAHELGDLCLRLVWVRRGFMGGGLWWGPYRAFVRAFAFG